MIQLIRILVTLLLIPASTALAGPPMSPKAHPRTFCDLAIDLGYPSRGYKENTGGCASNMTEVTPSAGKNGLNNNLAFYSMGHTEAPSKLQRVSLILNVNNIKQKAKAQAELFRVARGLANKIVGQMPADFESVVQNAKSKTWPIGEWTIEVNSSVWRTGLGQDTTIYFRPSMK